MISEADPPMKKVIAAFAAWKAINDQVKVAKRALDERDAARDASVAELEASLHALEVEAERLLLIATHALLDIKTPRSSTGDSTWG